jgi:sugar/nucleoside kinase (ribokinase family)
MQTALAPPCCRLGVNHGAVATHALFIGQSYIDVTFVADELPTGDEKSVARDYAVSFGGNAVTAAFCCAKLGVAPGSARLGGG